MTGPRDLRYAPTKIRRVMHRTRQASECIGRLEPGLHVTGLTAGQFSSLDAVEHMVDQLGPADVRISTWTSGLYDVQRAARIQLAGRIRSIRVLLDRATFEKSPKFAGPLIEALGFDAFRCLSVHAKVNIVDGDRGSAVMRSSMNLNKNLRTEQFDISCDAEVSAFYREWFDGLWDEAGRSNDNRAIIKAVFDRWSDGDESVAKPKPAADPAPRVRSKPAARARSPRGDEVGLSMSDLDDLLGD